MPIEDPVEPTLQFKFESEKIRRLIEECNDLNTLKTIAHQLLHLHLQQSAVANWATKRAAEAEQTVIINSKNLDKSPKIQ